MKIAMFLDEDFVVDPRVENEARELHKAGFEIHLFTLAYKTQSPAVEDLGYLHLYRYPAPDLIYRLSALVYTLPFYRWYVQRRVQRFCCGPGPGAVPHLRPA